MPEPSLKAVMTAKMPKTMLKMVKEFMKALETKLERNEEMACLIWASRCSLNAR